MIQAIIVNSGNANACTGKQGMLDAIEMQKVTATKYNVKQDHVAVASTGVIGLQMSMDKIIPHINQLEIASTSESAQDFGGAILPTYTFRRSARMDTEIVCEKIIMPGSSKGSGMIERNMGTVFGFITTEGKIESGILNEALKDVVNQTFNCITVDGDP